MLENEFPQEVLDFIARRIDSVPHLEALLLFQESPDMPWTAAEIAGRVYVSREKARAILKDLMRHGFIFCTAPGSDHYCYQQAWDENGLMPKVAEAYRKHLVNITGFIHEKAASTSVHDFARAFKFTKKE